MRRWTFLIAAAMPAGALAQEAPPPTAPQQQQQQPAEDAETVEEPDIIVRGTRGLPGAVVGDIPPEEQLGPADIRSYGVNSVAELLNELSPQTRSGRGSGGQPVVLLNGRRISGFAEIRDLPTEAIARVDILPEEVALKYGYRADQRVVNFVLRQRFRATTVELGDRITTRGDRNQPEAELDLLTIRRDRRINLHSSYRQSDALLESQRDVISTPSLFSLAGNVVGVDGSAIPGLATTVTDPGPFRTLLGQSRTFSTNGSYARRILANVSATVNGRIEATTGRSLQGLPTVSLALPVGNPFSPVADAVLVQRAMDAPLTQRTRSIASRLGATFNGDVGRWRWSLIGGYDRVDSRTLTDAGVDASGVQARLNAGDPTADPFGPLDLPRLARNRASSTSQVANIDAQANGTLFRLPAGEAATSLSFGGDLLDFTSRSTRAGVTQRGAVARDSASGRVNLDLPITSRTRNFGAAIGTLSVNLNAALEELSDFGTLTTVGYGANWAPVEAVRVIASVTEQDGAPSPQQLGNPSIVTPNVRVFDFVRGTTATVTAVSGGNPALGGFSTHTAKLGLTIRPSKSRDLTLIANYVRASVDDPVAGFPAATAEIAGAFPDRFTRDADGQLLRIDTRPVNFARTERSELRYGFNFSVPIRSEIQKQLELFRAGNGPNPFAGLTPPGRRGAGAGRPDGAPSLVGEARPERGGGPGGFGGRGGGAGGGGRLQLALYHTWHLTDEVLVAPGGPRLDLLNGDAIGSGGGRSRHELEGQAGYANNGLGARLSVNFRSATAVTGGTAAAPTELSFGSLTIANLRLFADLGQRLDLVRRQPWLRGARVAVAVDNLFDSRQRVRDAAGATPVNFQPDLLDPLGRTVRLSVRKLF